MFSLVFRGFGGDDMISEFLNDIPGGKFAALLGPLVVGFVTYISGSTRTGILSLAIFFIIGIFIFVKHKKLNMYN